MTQDEIFEIIKNNTLEVIPELEADSITIEESLKNLGANSIDRMEILEKLEKGDLSLEETLTKLS